MPQLRLAGCRSDSLLGYLKALGVLRTVAQQSDSRARGIWDDAVFVLETSLEQPAIEEFFTSSYAPTPVISPWNNSSGFDRKGDRPCAIMERIAAMREKRWQPYCDAIAFVNERYVDSGKMLEYLDDKGKVDKDKKSEFIADIRAHCPEAFLPWLDAAVVVTANRLEFPYLLGSGGNDGRLDFSVNFAERAVEMCGDEPLKESAALLRDSLFDTAESQMISDAAIGQFSARHTGGANATTGFGAASLVNPWDYILAIEGALMFSGSIGRRTDRAPGRPTFPFAIRAVAAGYSSASAEEESRGELWLPIWSGKASLPSVADLLRKGRIDLPGTGGRSIARTAVLATEAAAAVATMGVPLGLSRLERTAYVQRNGLAFAAVPLGSIHVEGRFDDGIAIISRRLGNWLERAQRRISELGVAAREASYVFDDRLLRFSSVPASARNRARQELLVAVADLDRALLRAQRDDAPPSLPSDIIDALDDGTPAHRVALAIASYGSHRQETSMRNELRAAGDEPIRVMRDLLGNRLIADARAPRQGWLRPGYYVQIADVVEFLEFEPAERVRFARLLRAYAMIRFNSQEQHSADRETPDDSVAASYAVLKLVFDNPRSRDERVTRLLFAQNAAGALTLAVRRARAIPYLPAPPRDVSLVNILEPAWTAGALLLPIADEHYGSLLRAALAHAVSTAAVREYLDSLRKEQTSE